MMNLKWNTAMLWRRSATGRSRSATRPRLTKPSNAGHILAAVGKSGYEEAADLAIEVIENPKEIDAVRLYALQALRNLFAAPDVEDPKASWVKKPERELKAIQTLIAFIVRKPPLGP